MSKKAMLIILDGWGLGPKPSVDAIAQGDTPYFDSLHTDYPSTELITYGEDVGLPEGQMGNSEVGHLNLGAGRVVYQELARINKAIREQTLQQNPTLINALKKASKADKPVHLMGLLSDGGVHSHINHAKALIDIALSQGCKKVYFHAFLDGRDTDPKGGARYLEDLINHMKGKPAYLVSIIGRYFAMDRDNRWERIKKAYDLLVNGVGERTKDPVALVRKRYSEGQTDEFIEPIIVEGDQGEVVTMNIGDTLLCFNFRTDRPREISIALTQKDFPDYDMKKLSLNYLTMTRYDATFKGVEVLFTKDDIKDTLGETLAKAGKTQVRIAETEKYPHVTFFFNGGREEPFPLEERILVPSPKVATYDLQPEMSAEEVTDKIMNAIETKAPDFICLNYANADMVGHTGDFTAAMKAAEFVDGCLANLVPLALEKEYNILIIADHGNSDYMVNDDGTPNTAHTTNPVPLIVVSTDKDRIEVSSGKLGDIAPTILHLMGLEKPTAMECESLVTINEY